MTVQALEIISYTLAENTVTNPIRLVTELCNRHNAGESSAGSTCVAGRGGLYQTLLFPTSPTV